MLNKFSFFDSEKNCLTPEPNHRSSVLWRYKSAIAAADLTLLRNVTHKVYQTTCRQFYQQFTNSFFDDFLSPKNLQTEPVSTKKLQNTFDQSVACKILANLTTVGNFDNIL